MNGRYKSNSIKLSINVRGKYFAGRILPTLFKKSNCKFSFDL